MGASGDRASGRRTNVPVNKVTVSTLAGALAAILVWLLRTYTSIDIPPEVQDALIVLLTFLAGWLTPPGAGEVVLASPAPTISPEPLRAADQPSS